MQILHSKFNEEKTCRDLNMASYQFKARHVLYLVFANFCVILLIFYPQNNAIKDIIKNEENVPVIEAEVNIVEEDKTNFLDGCYHVYLDVGSNIGVQVRKLFEPEKYPDASVHSIFNKYFGSIEERRKAYAENNGKIVCAVGFEPNSHHTKYLKEVESSYNSCGWNVKFMTESAASDHDGTTKFYTDEAYQYNEWGGGILPPKLINIAVDNVKNKQKPNFMNVTLIRLSDFLKHVVGKRKLPVQPSTISPPKVVMKMDIEGSEVDVIPDMIFNGGFQYVNSIMVEWHQRLENLPERKKAHSILEGIVKSLSDYSNTMKEHDGKFDFNLVNMDDETYATSKFDFPKCSL